MEVKKLAYLGSDKAFEREVRKVYESVSNMHLIEFNSFFLTKNSSLPNVYSSLLEFFPRLIFLDFSDKELDLTYFFTTIQSNHDLNKCVIVGLLGEFDEEKAASYFSSGCHLIYTKDNDLKIILNDSYYLAAGVMLLSEIYAKAKIKKDQKTFRNPSFKVLSKLSFVADKAVGIETDLNITQEHIGLLTFQNELLKKLKMNKLNKVSKYYANSTSHTSYAHYFSLGLNGEVAEQFLPNKKELKFWFADQLTEDKEKFTQVLIIDRMFSYYKKNTNLLLGKNFKIDTVSLLDKDCKLLKELRPNIIVMQIFEESEDDILPEDNDEGVEGEEKKKPSSGSVVDIIQNILIHVINDLDYEPILLLFNFNYPTIKFKYPYVITDTKKIDEVDLSVFIKSYQKSKQFQSNFKQKNFDGGKLAILPGNMPSLKLWIDMPIVVFSLTECEVIFYCDLLLEARTIVYFNHPYNFYVTVKPIRTEVKGYAPGHIFKGIINAATDEVRKRFRTIVNELVFTPLQEKKEGDKAMQDMLKEKYLKEKKDDLLKKKMSEED